MDCSLNEFYRSLNLTKQGVHDMLNRLMRTNALNCQVLKMAKEIRIDHPSMGIREMYYKIKPQGIGRDKFEYLCLEEEMKVKRSKNFRKTTNSLGVTRFPNLIDGLTINSMNQVWQSDITYYELKGRFYYITLIQDAFTKRIVGHNCSKRLTTEQTTLPSLKKALKTRKNQSLAGLIFHSDGGGQYYDKEFKSLTGTHHIINSMGETCYENAMAESLNGVIKNKYLKYFKIDSFQMLEKQLDRVVKLYNSDKPHSSLNRLTPLEFENIHCNKKRKKAILKSELDLKKQINKTKANEKYQVKTLKRNQKSIFKNKVLT